MRAAKVDSNHSDITEGLRACGWSVQSMAKIGEGCPDLLIGVAPRTHVILELKVDGGRLTPKQKTWHRDWRGSVHLAHSLEEAIAICNDYLKAR